MWTFLARSVVRLIAVILGVSALLFFLSQLAGDPASLYSPPSASPEVVEATRMRLGLDQPLILQLFDALKAPFTLDFPNSYLYNGPVLGEALTRLGTSASLILIALVVSTLLAFVVGSVGALYPTKFVGRLAQVTTYLAHSLPYFWLLLVMVLVFAIWLGWLPATGSSGWQSYIIPTVTLIVAGYSTTSRLARGELLDVMGRDYIDTARSKGLAPRRIFFVHVVPASAPPLLAWIGIEFSLMVSSLLIIEPLVGFNGIGEFLFEGVTARDFPVVQVSILLIAVAVTVVNILIDLAARTIDPRISVRSES